MLSELLCRLGEAQGFQIRIPPQAKSAGHNSSQGGLVTRVVQSECFFGCIGHPRLELKTLFPEDHRDPAPAWSANKEPARRRGLPIAIRYSISLPEIPNQMVLGYPFVSGPICLPIAPTANSRIHPRPAKTGRDNVIALVLKCLGRF
jgi:hypothetical protein